MKIVNLEDEVVTANAGAWPQGQLFGEIKDGIINALNCPVRLGRLEKVEYEKSHDAYVVSFDVDGPKLRLRAETGVAQFVASCASHKSGYWHGRMFAGVLVDAVFVNTGRKI
jgi:hypothetical protein